MIFELTTLLCAWHIFQLSEVCVLHCPQILHLDLSQLTSKQSPIRFKPTTFCMPSSSCSPLRNLPDTILSGLSKLCPTASSQLMSNQPHKI